MPIYEFRCQACGYQFSSLEAFDSLREKPCQAPVVKGNLPCEGIAVRVPSLPGPAQFNCSMPTYRKGT